jgi:hypothetical protein
MACLECAEWKAAAEAEHARTCMENARADREYARGRQDGEFEAREPWRAHGIEQAARLLEASCTCPLDAAHDADCPAPWADEVRERLRAASP